MNGTRWRPSITILQTPQHNLTHSDTDTVFRRYISKSTEVSSDSSVREWPSRTPKRKETTHVPNVRPGDGESGRNIESEGETKPKSTPDRLNSAESVHSDLKESSGTFQQIDNKPAWMYSAFFDHVAAQNGNPAIRIFGIAHKDLLRMVYCNFTNLTREGNVIKAGSVTELPEQNGLNLTTSYIECDLPANTRPTHVSVSFQKNITATNRFQIIYPGTLIRNFTVCYSVLHSDFNSSSQLIQSLEMNRILGAEHFVVYNYSISPSVDQILQRYQQKGLVTVLQWPLPTNETFYFGQKSALNDCSYRNRNISRFIVVVDTDEFMIPTNHSNWMEMIAAVSPEEYDVSTFVHSPNPSKKAHAKTGCFVVLSSFFSTSSNTNWTSLPSKFSFTEEDKITILKYNILPLSQFLRSKIFARNQRTKYIARPEFSYSIGMHRVHTFVNSSSCTLISSNLSLVHHYRKLDRRKSLLFPLAVMDTSMLRFKSRLYPRVMEQFKLFPNIFM